MDIIKLNKIKDLNSLKHPAAFDDIDLEFAKFLLRINEAENVTLALTAALLSHALRNNHICMRLEEIAGRSFPFDNEYGYTEQALFIQLPDMETWLKALRQAPKVITFSGETKPIVVDKHHRVYLQRYYKYEQDLAGFLIAKMAVNTDPLPAPEQGNISHLSTYFQNEDGIDHQQLAVLASLYNKFTVITGSPGTGKTTVVATILAAHYQINPGLRVGICAPTGKAAARLKESLHREIKNLHISESTKGKILTTETSTIRRLLKVIYQTPHFRYNKEHKLNIDLLVLDEASMVSQRLMCKLFYALEKNTRIILLGDKDQLASVEEGSVFGDICDALPINRFSNDFVDFCAVRSDQKIASGSCDDKANIIIELNKSHRFDNQQGIGLTKEAIKAGDSEKVLKVGKSNDPQILLRSLPRKNYIRQNVLNYLQTLRIDTPDGALGIRDYLSLDDISKQFEFINNFRILCAKRHGLYGINHINRIIIEHYMNTSELYPDSLPIMVTSNDNRLNLFNGDVGIVKNTPKGKRVFFPDTKDNFRQFSPAQLPAHESVFAMTVHKSQGSGFQKVLLILPDKDIPLLTRELLYTGVTRAEKYCEIWSYDSILKECVARKTVRDSGLKDLLLQI
ncbi:MAG: exodeoxyribonuclease V subunit alpha [Fidelibacterota bacterium]